LVWLPAIFEGPGFAGAFLFGYINRSKIVMRGLDPRIHRQNSSLLG
jgi:hypothetical protein